MLASNNMFFSLCLCVASLIISETAYAQMHALVRLKQPVADIILLDGGTVRMFTQDLEVWDASPSSKLWKRIPIVVNTESGSYAVRRISRFTQVGSVLVGSGHIILNIGSSGISAILRSTDNGRTFQPIAVGNDTLASADIIRRTDEGMLYFLDRVGRVWKSADTGSTWTNVKLPSQIPIGGARELDMVKASMGVCIDVRRNIHFTTNGWNTIITPMASSRPILRTQPTLLEYFNWNRRLVMTNSLLYLIEGPDIYKTATNDLLWERWDSVNTFNASDDRNTLAWTDVAGRLWTAGSGANVPKLLDENVLQPSLIRVYSSAVVTYREDTGPVVYMGGSKTRVYPRNSDEEYLRPYITAVGKSGEWGIDAIDHRSIFFELLHRDVKSGRWITDTTLQNGPVHELKLLSSDSVVFGSAYNRYVYNAKTRVCSDYSVRNPLSAFLSSPVSRFRTLVASDELDSTHVMWCEYRLQGVNFVCHEVVDSSRFGVESKLVSISIPAVEIASLLNSVSARGDEPLAARDINITDNDKASFEAMVDTIFIYDGYFDVLDLYRPPPEPRVQIEHCQQRFREIASSVSDMPPEVITQAILAWRHMPRDEFSRYQIEFEGRSGNFAHFSVERADDAHPPLMLPWASQFGGWRWHSWDRGLTQLFIKAMPAQSIPALFLDMARTPWILAAVASYVDSREYGRRHVWSAGQVTPSARK